MDDSNAKEQTYTIDEAINAIGIGKFQWKILIVTGSLWAGDAIEIMILTFLMPLLEEEWNLTTAQSGTIGSAYFAGELVGSLIITNLSDRIGRRKCIIISNAFQIVFGMLSAAATEMYFMMFTRFMVGVCLGGSTCSYTLYAEYAPSDYRGRLLILQQSFWAVGCTANALIAWLTLELLDWRWYLIISSFPLCIILIFALRLPESARYLATTNNMEEAETILNKALAQNRNILNENRSIKLRQQDNVVVANRGNITEIFYDKYFKSTMLLFNVLCLTVFAYYGISFLSERFFDQVTESNNQNPNEKYWKIVVTTASELPGTMIAFFTLDQYGRKNTCIGSFAVFTLSTFILMDNSVQNSIIISVSLAFMSRMCISIAFLSLYVYFSEYYPTQIRNSSLGLATAISRLAGMATTYISQYDDITYAFYLYGLAGAIATICIFMLKHDTKGVDMTGDQQLLHVSDADKETHTLQNDELMFSMH
eukprot:263585_1